MSEIEEFKYCIKNGNKIPVAQCRNCGQCQIMFKEYFFCLVVGSRTFSDYDMMKRKLDKILSTQNGKVVIVSGGAKGADSLSERYAHEKGYMMVIFRANWNLGKAAGYIRNEEMHRFISHADRRGCVAFWKDKSRGTAHNFGLAEKYGNQLRKIIC